MVGRNKITMIENSNRRQTNLTLFTWVNSLCMPIFTVNRKGTTKFCTEKTRRALGRAHVHPTKVFPRLAVNKTILKPRLAAATGANTYMWDFPDVIKFRVAALKRYRRKQSGFGIPTIIRIGLKG